MHHSDPPPVWLVAVFPLFFVTMWIVVCYIISKKGWSSLARLYRVEKLPEGQRFDRLSGYFSMQGSYNNALIASISPEGFGLGILILFRAFHPPLLIPWSNVTVTEVPTLFSRCLNVVLSGGDRTFRVRMPLKARESLEKYCRIEEIHEPASTRKWGIGLLVLAWLGLVLGLALFVGSLNIPRITAIDQHKAVAGGRITELTLQMHNTVRYEFEVGGMRYESQGRSGLPNLQSGELHVGDVVMVFYNSLEPDESMLEDPHSELAGEEASVGFMALVMPTVIILSIAYRMPLSWISGRRGTVNK